MVNFLTSHTLNSIITCKTVQNLLEAVSSRVASVTQLLSCVQLFETPCVVARQAPLSMEFPRQEYWSGLLFPSPVELPNTGIKTESPASPALAGQSYFSRGSVVPAEGTQKRKRSPPKKGRLIKSVFWVVLRAHPLDVKSTIVTSHGGPPHPLRRAP